MTIYQISVFIENKPGRLSEIVGHLAQAKIDIRALSIADTTDFGILRLIVDKPAEAIQILKSEGVTVSKTEVIGVKLLDEPGSLARVLTILSESQIAVEYTYAFITHSKENACVVLRVEDNARAIEVLKKAGITLLDFIG